MGMLKPTHISTFELQTIRNELKMLDDIFPPRFGWRKRAAAACGIPQSAFSRKMSDKVTTLTAFFNLDQLGRIASCVSEMLMTCPQVPPAWRKPTPPGWPIITFRAYRALVATFMAATGEEPPLK